MSGCRQSRAEVYDPDDGEELDEPGAARSEVDLGASEDRDSERSRKSLRVTDMGLNEKWPAPLDSDHRPGGNLSDRLESMPVTEARNVSSAKASIDRDEVRRSAPVVFLSPESLREMAGCTGCAAWALTEQKSSV